MEKIPLCVIGCGGMGHRHILAYRELENSGIGNIEIVAVCDLNPKNADLGAREVERLFGKKPMMFTDLDKALACPDIAAVDVVTDPSYHHAVAVPALQAGKHAIVEKPLGLTVRACQAMKRVVFVQAGVPSRTHIDTYKTLNEQVDSLVEQMNRKYGMGHWKPVVYIREHLGPLTLMALRRMANFCVVSSLHDGMNLVAKEFVASRFDGDGVLILSPFTGAARELTDALLVNPYATDHFAEAIKNALEMSEAERRRRMRRMREVVRENNVYKWASDIVATLLKFESGD